MVSGLTLLPTEDTYRSRDRWSYVLLAEELRRVCAEPRKDAPELFSRMCFNALISNMTTIPAIMPLFKGMDWKLSPAYDLTPSTPVSLERRDLALICGDAGRYANASNLLSQSVRFLLKQEEAEKTISAMEERTRDTWYETARKAGASERDCTQIAGAFVYPGFRYQIREDCCEQIEVWLGCVFHWEEYE